MIHVKVTRLYSSDQGTQGILAIHNMIFCYTLELPWNDNIPDYSCIPIGHYIVHPWRFHHYRKAFHITHVPNRSCVLIHNGNYAGDKRKGYKTHVLGCMLVGSHIGYLAHQLAILNSRPTLARLVETLHWSTFLITIDDVDKSKYDPKWLDHFEKTKALLDKYLSNNSKSKHP